MVCLDGMRYRWCWPIFIFSKLTISEIEVHFPRAVILETNELCPLVLDLNLKNSAADRSFDIAG